MEYDFDRLTYNTIYYNIHLLQLIFVHSNVFNIILCNDWAREKFKYTRRLYFEHLVELAGLTDFFFC